MLFFRNAVITIRNAEAALIMNIRRKFENGISITSENRLPITDEMTIPAVSGVLCVSFAVAFRRK